MGIGGSIFLIALGAVLAFAVNVSASGIDLNTVGVILLVIGVIGLAASLLLMNGAGAGWYGGRRTRVIDDAYGDDRPRPVSRRRVVRRRDVM